jgi:PAS domain S-box-containing protein
MVIVEDDSTISMVNGEFEKLTGYSKEEAEGRMKWTQLVTEGKLAKLQEYHRMRRTGQSVPPRRYENRFIDKAGNIRDAMISIDLIPGTKKSIVSALDITERRKFEEALRQSERTYQATFQNTGTATILIEEDMRILLANEEFERLSGFSKQEIEGKIKWTQFGSEEDLPIIAEYHRLRRIDPDAAPNKFEFRFFDRRGKLHIIRATVDMISGTKLSVASYRDITDLKMAQSMLQKEKEEQELLLDNIDTMVWYAVDPETYRKVNYAFADFLGLKKEDVQGKKTYEVRTHCEAEVCVEGNRKVFEESKPIQTLEWVTTARGERRLMWVKKIPEFGPDGKVEYLVCSGYDITDLKKAEDVLHLANRKLSLLGSMTRHDILNKLSIIAGYSEILGKYIGDENGRRFLQNIMKASDDIDTLLASQRDCERIGTNKPEWLDVEELLKRSVAGIDLHDIKLEIDLQGLEIYVDPLVERVFYNLIDNSSTHGEKASLIRVYLEEADGGVKIVFQDDGIGIPVERKERIFVPGHGESGGYGLYLSREILVTQETTIEERGIEGSGARLEIYVPDGRHRYPESGQGQLQPRVDGRCVHLPD